MKEQIFVFAYVILCLISVVCWMLGYGFTGQIQFLPSRDIGLFGQLTALFILYGPILIMIGLIVIAKRNSSTK